ncbi:DMT family transporter [Actinomyces slackii]|uniref:Predicted permease, DMT superfamily n=1 Tax=Actinomyces slackii TaxID=52774 RepID=A0A3S4TDA8_9ACTO|nr:DMT family transporter [Actinomyces slackii]VEG75269.1 Predicted permease, DMT superfamily [Actinomyces slackii]
MARLTSLLPAAAMLAVTAMWGSTFFMLKDALDHVATGDFLAMRFTIAAIGGLALAGRRLARLTRRQVLSGLGAGVIYGLAQLAQTEGIRFTEASTAGFVTAVYVVLTPLLGLLLLRTRVGPTTAMAAVLAIIGIGVLSLRGFDVSPGVLLCLLSAVGYALHIMVLGLRSRGADALALAAVQMVAIAALCWVGALPGGVHVPATWQVWGPLLWMAIASGLLAILGQTWAQARMSAARAAVLMSMEPVWSAFFAILLGGESLTWRMVIGGGLVITAMLLSELGPAVRADRLVRRAAGAGPPRD